MQILSRTSDKSSPNCISTVTELYNILCLDEYINVTFQFNKKHALYNVILNIFFFQTWSLSNEHRGSDSDRFEVTVL